MGQHIHTMAMLQHSTRDGVTTNRYTPALQWVSSNRLAAYWYNPLQVKFALHSRQELRATFYRFRETLHPMKGFAGVNDRCRTINFPMRPFFKDNCGKSTICWCLNLINLESLADEGIRLSRFCIAFLSKRNPLGLHIIYYLFALSKICPR